MNNGNVSWMNGGELLLAFVCFIAACKREEEDDGFIDGGLWRGEDVLRKLGNACKEAKWIWIIVLGSATWSTMPVSENWLWVSYLCVELHVVRA